MKMKLIGASMIIAVATTFGQNGIVQDVKHKAKKAGETIKDGLETVGEKTKETAKTAGKKTKETAEAVGEKTQEAGQTVARKTTETVNGAEAKAAKQTTQKNHHRSEDTSSKVNAENTEGQPASRERSTPLPSPDSR